MEKKFKDTFKENKFDTFAFPQFIFHFIFQKIKRSGTATFHEERMKSFEINLLKEIELFAIIYGLPSQVNTVNFGSLIFFIHEFYLLAR